MAKKSTAAGSRTKADRSKSSPKSGPKAGPKAGMKSGKKAMKTEKTRAATTAKKKPTPKKQTLPKTVSKAKTRPKPSSRKNAGSSVRSERMDSVVYEKNRVGVRSSRQAGDLQGLSNTAEADSESVDELLEEGNAFEAGIVKGVEDAPYPEDGEIFTREVSEDDVPEEYLDED